MIDFPKYERLQGEVAGLRGQLDHVNNDLAHEKRQFHLSHGDAYRRLLIVVPKAEQDPKSWLALEPAALEAVHLKRADVEALVALDAKVARLTARREQLGHDLQPRVALVNKLRDFIDSQSGKVVL